MWGETQEEAIVSALLPLRVIHRRSSIDISTFVGGDLEAWLPHFDWILRAPKSVVTYDASGEKRSSLTAPLAIKICWTAVVFNSQTRTVISYEPDARNWPLRESVIDETKPKWLSSKRYEKPVAGFQHRSRMQWVGCQGRMLPTGPNLNGPRDFVSGRPFSVPKDELNCVILQP